MGVATSRILPPGVSYDNTAIGRVVIEEELTNVRTTKITIKIDSEIVNEFITKPDEEFLLAMAEDTAAKTFNYLKN